MRHLATPILSGAVLFGAIAACTPRSDSPAGAPPGAATAQAPVAALPFVDNDYESALARARESNLPLFVEVWAPW